MYVTLVNFVTTAEGLEEQLLNAMVHYAEAPLARQWQEALEKKAGRKTRMQQTEDLILSAMERLPDQMENMRSPAVAVELLDSVDCLYAEAAAISRALEEQDQAAAEFASKRKRYKPPARVASTQNPNQKQRR